MHFYLWRRAKCAASIPHRHCSLDTFKWALISSKYGHFFNINPPDKCCIHQITARKPAALSQSKRCFFILQTLQSGTRSFYSMLGRRETCRKPFRGADFLQESLLTSQTSCSPKHQQPHFPVSTVCCTTAISKQGRSLPASCCDCLQMLLQWQELATIQPARASSEVSELVELQASAADYPFCYPFHFTARISALATIGALNLFNDPMGCNLYSPSHLLPISVCFLI